MPSSVGKPRASCPVPSLHMSVLTRRRSSANLASLRPADRGRMTPLSRDYLFRARVGEQVLSQPSPLSSFVDQRQAALVPLARRGGLRGRGGSDRLQGAEGSNAPCAGGRRRGRVLEGALLGRVACLSGRGRRRRRGRVPGLRGRAPPPWSSGPRPR